MRLTPIHACPDPIDANHANHANHDDATSGQGEASFRLDRRTAARYPTSGRVTALRRDHGVDAYRHPTCPLELCNISDGGLAAISEVPLDADETVSVYFPPHGVDGGFELFGHIVRCQPRHEDEATDQPVRGYEVAIRFDPAVAA